MTDYEQFEKDNERLSKNSNNSNDFLKNFVKLPEKEGKTKVRILPSAAPGKFDRPKSPIYQNTRIHALDDMNVHCLRELNSESGRWMGNCPVCSWYSHLWEEATKLRKVGRDEEANDLEEQARKLKPNERFYYNVIVRGKESEGPKILSVGKQLQAIIIKKVCGSESRAGVAVWDPVKGCDLVVEKLMKGGKWANYESSEFADPSPLGDPDQVASYLEHLHDLVSLRNVKPYADVKKYLQRYLGVIPQGATDSNFDVAEYQPALSTETLTNDVIENSVAKSVSDSIEPPFETTSVQTTTTVSNDDDTLEDDDFKKQFMKVKAELDGK